MLGHEGEKQRPLPSAPLLSPLAAAWWAQDLRFYKEPAGGVCCIDLYLLRLRVADDSSYAVSPATADDDSLANAIPCNERRMPCLLQAAIG